MDHIGHTVKWILKDNCSYELLCQTCNLTTRHSTKSPNTLDEQPYEQAIKSPEEITVTLEVQSLRNKTNTDWR